jgi:hypothetical protein
VVSGSDAGLRHEPTKGRAGFQSQWQQGLLKLPLLANSGGQTPGDSPMRFSCLDAGIERRPARSYSFWALTAAVANGTSARGGSG